MVVSATLRIALRTIHSRMTSNLGPAWTELEWCHWTWHHVCQTYLAYYCEKMYNRSCMRHSVRSKCPFHKNRVLYSYSKNWVTTPLAPQRIFSGHFDFNSSWRTRGYCPNSLFDITLRTFWHIHVRLDFHSHSHGCEWLLLWCQGKCMQLGTKITQAGPISGLWC